MLPSKDLVEQIKRGNQALFEASCMNVRAYFASNPSNEELIKHFVGRMVNERMNMVEISAQVAGMADCTDPLELQDLSRQAYDEAVHFNLVKEIVEKLQGSEINMEETIASERERPTAKGADLLIKYDAQNNPIALALYQLIAEGRAEAVWDEMSKCIDDLFIASRYAKIAVDEGFHSEIGARKLEKLITDEASLAYALSMADKIRKDLFDISCENTTAACASLNLVNSAYGWEYKCA